MITVVTINPICNETKGWTDLFSVTLPRNKWLECSKRNKKLQKKINGRIK